MQTLPARIYHQKHKSKIVKTQGDMDEAKANGWKDSRFLAETLVGTDLIVPVETSPVADARIEGGMPKLKIGKNRTTNPPLMDSPASGRRSVARILLP